MLDIEHYVFQFTNETNKSIQYCFNLGAGSLFNENIQIYSNTIVFAIYVIYFHCYFTYITFRQFRIFSFLILIYNRLYRFTLIFLSISLYTTPAMANLVGVALDRGDVIGIFKGTGKQKCSSREFGLYGHPWLSQFSCAQPRLCLSFRHGDT